MKKSRIKIQLPPIRTREDAEFLMTDLAQIENNKRKVIADRDAALLAINDNVAGPLAVIEEAIALRSDALCRWAESNPAEFPRGRKSLELANGTLGFRTGTPRLSLLNRAWNWEKVLAAVQGMLPNFIRNKPEVDRESIISHAEELAEFLPAVGLKVTQAESFFIEPKLADMDARKSINKEAA